MGTGDGPAAPIRRVFDSGIQTVSRPAEGYALADFAICVFGVCAGS